MGRVGSCYLCPHLVDEHDARLARRSHAEEASHELLRLADVPAAAGEARDGEERHDLPSLALPSAHLDVSDDAEM